MHGPCLVCHRPAPRLILEMCRSCYQRQRLVRCWICQRWRPYASKGLCSGCYKRSRMHLLTTVIRPFTSMAPRSQEDEDEIARRIEIYQQRAAQELPLFDPIPLASEGVAS